MIEENPGVPNGLTLAELVERYKTDRVSGWRKLRYPTRRNQETVLRRMVEAHGHKTMASIRGRDIEEMYLDWSGDGEKVSMGHAFVSKLRTICGFGAGMLEDMECNRIALYLKQRKFPMGEPRKQFMTAAQCTDIRIMARNYGYNSIALVQALQFELMLRQKDCLGEWVPLDEPGDSEVLYHGEKWLRGLRWEEIDGDLILRHTTSKKEKELVVDLKLAPMVLEEIRLLPDFMKQPRGPVVISEHNCMPWQAVTFRQKWRMIATAAGIPKDIFCMDNRASGVTEATQAGASLESIKHAATHSDISMTQRYSRGAEGKIADVQRARLAHRQAQGGGNVR